MKKKLSKSTAMIKTSLFIITLVSVLIMNNCQYFEQLSYKEWKETSGINDGIDIYIGGYYQNGDYYPCYWKNGEIIELGSYSGSSQVKSIVLDGDDIYCGGYYYIGSVRNACYWKNSVQVKVELDNTGNFSEIYSIAVIGGVVYACGYEDGKACYWINGKKYSLNNPGTDSVAYSIAVDSDTLDFYIVGSYFTTANSACYWKNGESCVTLAWDDSEALAIALSNGKVYIGGYCSGSTPCYWIDEKCVEFGSSGQVNAISIYDGNVYCAGQSGSLTALWKDGSIAWTKGTGIGYGVAIYDNNNYVAGYIGSTPYLWKNGDIFMVDASISSGAAYCIAVRAKR